MRDECPKRQKSFRKRRNSGRRDSGMAQTCFGQLRLVEFIGATKLFSARLRLFSFDLEDMT